jgi:hypothetical protein
MTEAPSLLGGPILWAQDDLVRRLSHALDVAQQAIEVLASEGYTDPGEPANSLRGEKVISETAFLLVAAAGLNHHSSIQERLGTLAEQLIPYARTAKVAVQICLEPALSLDWALPHICLTQLGRPAPDFDHLLEQSLASSASAGRERPPHRLLEQEWIQALWRGSLRNRTLQPAAACASVLNHPMDLLQGSREDLYAFTHALMYVDGCTQPWQLPRSRDEILAEAEAALARCLDDQDYDLCGELLLAWPLSASAWSPAAGFAFSVLARVEDQAGFLPAPNTRLDRLSQLTGTERRRYWLATTYHTVYVMGLLCAYALRPGLAPPRSIAPVPPRGACDAVLPYLPSNGGAPQPHWMQEFFALDPARREALATLLWTAALRRKVVQRDFGAVEQLLHLGFTFSLADTPAATQAVELLDRLTALAPIIA